MYLCTSCKKTTKSREPMYKKVIYREDKSIEKEFPVCTLCFTGKPFVREIEAVSYIGFHKIVTRNPHNDRVQI